LTTKVPATQPKIPNAQNLTTTASPFDFEGELDLPMAPAASKPAKRWSVLVGAVSVLCLAIGLLAGFFIFRPSANEPKQPPVKGIAQKPKPPAEKEPKEKLVPKPIDIADLAKDQFSFGEKSSPPADVPKRAEKPKEVSAADLRDKGRDYVRTREYSLAEAIFTKALLICGESKEGQLLKAELYLRVAFVRETVEANKRVDPLRPVGGGAKKGELKPRWYDIESRSHARKIMVVQGINERGIINKIIEINKDHRSLFLEGAKIKR
jgi:hypothetical protein